MNAAMDIIREPEFRYYFDSLGVLGGLGG